MKKSLLNLILRGLSVIIKFLLTTYLAKNLPDYEYGEYSLFAFSISFFTILVGMEYFNYNARIFLEEKEDPFKVLNKQFQFHLGSYLFTLPIVSLLFVFNGLAFKWMIGFYLILVIDQLAQEIVRIVVLYGRPLTGTTLFFIKSSLWFVPLIALVQISPMEINLHLVFVFWLVGAVISLGIGIFTLSRIIPFKSFDLRPNWSDLKLQAYKAAPFLLATLSARGLMTFDKYILKYTSGEAMVGVMSFYFVFAMMMLTAVEAAISAIYFPDLVRGYNNGDNKKVKIIRRKMFFGITIIFAAAVLFSYMAFDYVLRYLDKSSFADNKNLLYIYLVAVAFQCYTLLPHYKLYAYKEDIKILTTHLIAFICGLLLYFWMGSAHGAVGIALSFGIASLLLFGFKSVAAYRLNGRIIK